MLFVVLHDRFRRALNESETIMLMSGSPFGDQHLNELVFDAARRRERSEFIAFYYSNIPEHLAKRALSTPNLQVLGATEAAPSMRFAVAPLSTSAAPIIGGIRDEWKPPEDPPSRP